MLGLISGWMTERKIRKSLDNILRTHLIGQSLGPIASFRLETTEELRPRFESRVYSSHPVRRRREQRREWLNQWADSFASDSIRSRNSIRSGFEPVSPQAVLQGIRDREYEKLASVFYRNQPLHDRTVDRYLKDLRNLVGEKQMPWQREHHELLHMAVSYCNRNPQADYRGIAYHLRVNEHAAKHIIREALDTGHSIRNYNRNIAPEGMHEHMIKSYCIDRRPIWIIADDISARYGLRVSPDTMKYAAGERYGNIRRNNGMAKRAYMRNNSRNHSWIS